METALASLLPMPAVLLHLVVEYATGLLFSWQTDRIPYLACDRISLAVDALGRVWLQTSQIISIIHDPSSTPKLPTWRVQGEEFSAIAWHPHSDYQCIVVMTSTGELHRWEDSSQCGMRYTLSHLIRGARWAAYSFMGSSLAFSPTLTAVGHLAQARSHIYDKTKASEPTKRNGIAQVIDSHHTVYSIR